MILVSHSLSHWDGTSISWVDMYTGVAGNDMAVLLSHCSARGCCIWGQGRAVVELIMC